jgi:signal transduction histidine kinase
MPSLLSRLGFDALPFADPVQLRQARLLHGAVLALVAVNVLSLPIHLVLPGGFAARLLMLASQLAVLTCGGIALLRLRQGDLERSALIVGIGLQISLAVVLLTVGLRSSAATFFTFSMAIVLVGSLGSRRALVGISLLSAALVAGVVAWQLADGRPDGLLPAPGLPPALMPLFFTVVLVGLALLVDRLGSTLRDAATDAREELARREVAEAQLLASHRLEVIGRLAASVAHDFNNLLTVIRGNSDVARERLGEDHAAASELTMIAEAADRAAHLTERLLVLSRRHQPELRDVDLTELMTDLGPLLRRLVGTELVTAIDCEPGLWGVEGDPRQIEQVLINLAANARDAMPDGGTLRVTCTNATFEAPRRLNEIELPAGDYVRIEVADTGMGMEAGVLGQVFEPFFTTKPEGRGTGLGLATCFSIVRGHGGAIAVRSEVGVGTTFELYFPRHELAAPTSEPAPRAAIRHRGSERVLVVDDDWAVRSTIARILRSLGYEVVGAEGGDEARARLEDGGEDVSLVLCDVMMPKGNGVELVRWLRSQRPAVPVLLVSGYADRRLARGDGELLRVPLLLKPFTAEELGERVRTVLDGWPSASQAEAS